LQKAQLVERVLRRGGIAEVDKKRAADVDSAALRQNFSSLAAMASAVVVAGDLSQLAEQDQDQEDNDHESEPAMARGRTLISHLSTRGFYLPAVKRRVKLAAAAGPSVRQLSHAVRAASEQNCSLQLAKSNRSITTVMTPLRARPGL
jgi:hypothetical protein